MSEEEIKDPQAVLAELRRVQEDIKTLRTEKEALEQERDTLTERVTALESDDSVTKYKQMAIKAEARLALKDQGIKDVDRVLKYATLDEVDLDDEGKLVNFDKAVKSVRDDFPEWFDKKRGVGSADIFKDTPPEPKKTGTEAQVARIFHKV